MQTSSKDASGGRSVGRWRIAVWGAAALLWLAPLAAMQFTDEVVWGVSDFVIFGIMLSVACGVFELAVRMTGDNAYRAAVGIAVGAAFLLVWANLAVGIIGNEENPLNTLYFGVLGVGVLAAVIGRFTAGGMARALMVMAVAQVAVAVFAQIQGHFTWVITVVYVVLWLTSARLFSKAAQAQEPDVAAS